jgi:hypothetical protein
MAQPGTLAMRHDSRRTAIQAYESASLQRHHHSQAAGRTRSSSWSHSVRTTAEGSASPPPPAKLIICGEDNARNRARLPSNRLFFYPVRGACCCAPSPPTVTPTAPQPLIPFLIAPPAGRRPTGRTAAQSRCTAWTAPAALTPARPARGPAPQRRRWLRLERWLGRLAAVGKVVGTRGGQPPRRWTTGPRSRWPCSARTTGLLARVPVRKRRKKPQEH